VTAEVQRVEERLAAGLRLNCTHSRFVVRMLSCLPLVCCYSASYTCAAIDRSPFSTYP
jgi:hypothetical protein